MLFRSGKMKLSTIRIWGYTQIAVGLINLDYQRHKEPVLLISALAVAFGTLFVLVTFIKSLNKTLSSKAAGLILSAIAVVVLGIQFLNI